MLRTHDAGTLRASDAGSTVTLAGWVARRRDHGGVVFLDLRDASGYVQVVVREEEAHHLRNEYCVLVTGEVRRRPEGNENPELPTGEIEVATSSLQVLSAAAPLPFPIETDQPASDDVRYKYRYLDLRRQGPARAIRLRSEVSRIARGVMAAHGFVEVETPSLTRSTPEGARDFVVPVRLQPGKWYALPQSPQLFKQLLMIGGLERYYQIARCFRDEDFRADRQPEFTQLDFEMSFVDRDDVLAIAEDVVRALWRELAVVRRPGDPADDLPRGDGPLRVGQARPALRHRADRAHRLLRRHPVPGLPGALRRRRRHARRRVAAAAGLRRLAGLGQVARRARAGVRDHRRGRHARRAGRQEHLRRRARRAGGGRRGGPGRLRLLRRRCPPHVAGTAGRGAQRDRPAPGADRARHVVVPVRRRLPDVRGDRGRLLDVHAPPVHVAHARVPGDLRRRQGRGAVRRLRHGDQRQRGDERVGAYPRRRAAGAGVRDPRDVARGGPGAVRVLPRGVRLRAAAARRGRARLGPAHGAAVGCRVDPRGHRLPEDRRRVRPADRRADADHRGAAQGGGHRRRSRRSRRCRTSPGRPVPRRRRCRSAP